MDENNVVMPVVNPLVLEESAIVSETDAAPHSSDDDEGVNDANNNWLSSNHISRNRHHNDHIMMSTQTTTATHSASAQEDHDHDDDDDENDSVDENEMKESAGPEDFYCSNLDDEDEAYVYKHLRSGREETVYVRKRYQQQQQQDEEEQQQQQQRDNSLDGASIDNASGKSANNNLESISKKNNHTSDGDETSSKEEQHQQPSTTAPQTNDPQSNNNNMLYQARLLKPRTSDAILSCPRCFNVVCMDCQQHERYSNQYRAMFVMNIGVDWTKKMMYDDAIGGLKAYNSSNVADGGTAASGGSGEGRSLGGIMEEDEVDDDDASMPDRIPQDDILQSSTNVTTNTAESSLAKEVYYSVHCSYCRLELAALDMNDEIYYFFGCIASS